MKLPSRCLQSTNFLLPILNRKFVIIEGCRERVKRMNIGEPWPTSTRQHFSVPSNKFLCICWTVTASALLLSSFHGRQSSFAVEDGKKREEKKKDYLWTFLISFYFLLSSFLLSLYLSSPLDEVSEYEEEEVSQGNNESCYFYQQNISLTNFCCCSLLICFYNSCNF